MSKTGYHRSQTGGIALIFMLTHIRHLLIGSPLPSEQTGETRLDKVRALASLSPDALASIAYANQEIFLGLVVAGAAGLAHSIDLALVITGLLALLTLSYRQTIAAYPSGGGSYTVARENLGELAGLVAAAALLIDYVLNAAVSLTAGVAALASAFPALWPYRAAVSLVLLLLITLVNLRGVREAGTAMTVPVYLFLAAYLGMIAWGIGVALVDGPGSLEAVAPPPLTGVTLFLLLRTFAAGATALTGVEAISNAVPIFKPPEARNAQRTMELREFIFIDRYLVTNAEYKQFVDEDKVIGVVGFTDTDSVLASGPTIQKAGIPFITAGATSPKIPDQVGDVMYLACFGDNVQAAVGAEYGF
ncbi:amino acid permease, partial [Gammaproteobacteria bacterium PRO2]|nr:amino acid permease [Gammaproteobacteria bacterium PRO2]